MTDLLDPSRPVLTDTEQDFRDTLVGNITRAATLNWAGVPAPKKVAGLVSASFSSLASGGVSMRLFRRNDANTSDDEVVVLPSIVSTGFLISSATPMLTAKMNHVASAMADGRVLVCGGYNGAVLADSQIYNPSTNAWSSVAALPAARSSASAALLGDGRVLVCGGWDGSAASSVAWTYAASTNTWAQVASMPTAKSRHLAVALSDGRVLVCGGYGGAGGNTWLKEAHIYSGTTNTWTAVASTRSNHVTFAGGLLGNGKVLVCGGMDISSFPSYTSFAEVFDPASNTWSQVASLPVGVSGNFGASIGGNLLVMGGYNETSGVQTGVYVYNASANTWTASTPLTQATSFAAAAAVGSRVFVCGGGVSDAYAPTQTYVSTAKIYG